MCHEYRDPNHPPFGPEDLIQAANACLPAGTAIQNRFVGGFNADKTKNERRKKNEPGIYPLELTSTMQPLAEHLSDVTLITGLDYFVKALPYLRDEK